MIIQLQPRQIAAFWDGIKHAIAKVTQIPEKDYSRCMNQALENLLTGKFQCWVIYEDIEEERKIHAIGITSLVKDTLLGYTSLSVEVLYGFRKLSDAMAREAIQRLIEFGQANGCFKLTAQTSSTRIMQLAELTGFEKTSEIYTILL